MWQWFSNLEEFSNSLKKYFKNLFELFKQLNDKIYTNIMTETLDSNVSYLKFGVLIRVLI